MRKYFSNPASFMNAPLLLDWNNPSWCAYFFAEVSALAYHDGTKAKILLIGKDGDASYRELPKGIITIERLKEYENPTLPNN